MRWSVAIIVLAVYAAHATAFPLTGEVVLSGPGTLMRPATVDPLASLDLSVEQSGSPVLIDWATQEDGIDPPIPVFINVKNNSLEAWGTVRFAVGSVLTDAFEDGANIVLGMPQLTGIGASTVVPVSPGVWEFQYIHWGAGRTGSISLLATIPGPAIGTATGSFAVNLTARVPEPAGLAGLSLLFLAGRRRGRGQRFRSHCGTP